MKYDVHVKTPQCPDEFQAEVIPDYIEADDLAEALDLAIQYLLDNGATPEEIKTYRFVIYEEVEFDGFKYRIKNEGEWRCADGED